MNIKEYKKLMKNLLKTNIVPFIWGKHGIGKTEATRQIAEEMGMELIYLTFGAVEDVGDIIGLQDFETVNGIKKVVHVAPEWFPTTGNKLIFIDEFPRAKPQILQAMFPFILEGRLHTHKLPENCKIIVAGNPPTDDYEQTDVSDTALLSRFCHIELTPSFTEWEEFVSENNGNSEVISFFSHNTSYLESKEKEFDLRTVSKVDRRNAYKLCEFANIEGVSESELRDVACGLLGPEIGLAYIAYIRDTRDKLNGEEIFSKYSSSLSKKVKSLKTERDLLSKALNEVIKLALAKVPTEKELKNIEQFLLDLPHDLSYKGCNDLITTGEDWFLTSIGESKDLIEKFKEA